MTADNQSYLRFSVEESVWFQRGQEVEDLVSISLYPDISIEEHDQYVTIRGALQLTGEYHKSEKNVTNETEVDSSARFLNEVNTRDDGINELKHRFPVDITIPRNRIQNLDEVYVSVDSFDYELPGNQCLQLVADLSISGIYNQSTQRDIAANTDQSQLEARDYDYHDVEDVFNDQHEDPFEQQEFEQSSIFHFDDDEESIDHFEHESPDHFEEGFDDDEFYTPIEVEARKEAYHEELTDTSLAEINRKDDSPQIEMKSRDEEWSYSNIAKLGNKQQTEHVEDEHEEKRDENALYLTKIFGKDDSHDFSRLKMYIVQNGDSLDSVSKRYDVAVQQLIRVNHLDQDRAIHDGQILYIPLEKSKSFS